MNEAIVQLQAVVRAFPGVRAVDGIDLTVPRGSLFGIVGPDGAGKTTTIRTIVGLSRVDSGDVRIRGESIGEIAELRSLIGYMPQRYSLYGDLTVQENMMFFGKLFGLRRAARRERAAQLLELVGLSKFHARRADALSGGMYKKLAVACSLLHQPALLVLDEPTNGVDPVSRRELWDLLYDLVARDVTVVVSTPDMDEAARCHELVLLNEGRVLCEGRPADLVSRLRHSVLIVACEDRYALENAVLDHADVFDCAPKGAKLRLLVGGDGRSVEAWLRDFGVDEVTRGIPSFEDVFIGLLHDPEALR